MINIIHGDAKDHNIKADLMFTDPPYELNGEELHTIIKGYDIDHLVLITSLRQLFEFVKHTELIFSFDFVLDAVVPKKSKALHQPNYTHQNGVYFRKEGVKSAFNRKLRTRSDAYSDNGYWPTLIRSVRSNMKAHGMAKNETTIADIIGSFEVKTVVDPFAGSGSTGLAAFELDKDCTLIDIDLKNIESMQKTFKFLR